MRKSGFNDDNPRLGARDHGAVFTRTDPTMLDEATDEIRSPVG